MVASIHMLLATSHVHASIKETFHLTRPTSPTLMPFFCDQCQTQIVSGEEYHHHTCTRNTMDVAYLGLSKPRKFVHDDAGQFSCHKCPFTTNNSEKLHASSFSYPYSIHNQALIVTLVTLEVTLARY